jgi:hypothetical protein
LYLIFADVLLQTLLPGGQPFRLLFSPVFDLKLLLPVILLHLPAPKSRAVLLPVVSHSQLFKLLTFVAPEDVQLSILYPGVLNDLVFLLLSCC